MKKNYFLTLLLTFITAITFGQTAVITGYVDGPCSGAKPRAVEIYVDGTVDFTDWNLVRQSNGGGYTSNISLTALGSVTDSFVYITNDATAFDAEFSITTNVISSSSISSNGDDAFQITNNSGTVIDRFGQENVDGTGTAWEHVDTYYYRKDGATPNAGSFDVSNWTIGAQNLLDGQGTCNSQAALSTLVPFGSYSTTASTTPNLTINTPTNGQVFSASQTDVSVTITVDNFTFSGDDGSGGSNGSGDGYIKQSLTVGSNSPIIENKFDSNDQNIQVTPGESYTINMELVDNSGNSLATPVSKTVNFSVALACDLQLGTITKTCDAETSGVDTYSVSIAFTGGNTSTYTLNADNGTIGGDNPSSTASGTITITGVNEGTDIVFTAVGDASNSSCNLTRNISSPTCVGFPISESFNYTVGDNLTDQTEWEKINSGDDIVIAAGSLDYAGLETSTNNKITFSGSGAEALRRFTNINSGNVYASFLLKVTAFQTGSNPDVTDGGYIAALAGSNSGYDARVWVRPNPDTNGTTYDIGFGYQSSNPPFTTTTYNLNDVVFIVMAYNKDNDEISLWVNPDASSFETTPPTATLSTTDPSAPSAINTFILRQDSTNETPSIEVDEVRISTSWADVTPKDATASVKDEEINGFAAFPNPVKNKELTIRSASSDTKKVTLYSLIGRKVFSEKFDGTQKLIDVSTVNTGVYILKVVENNKISTRKLVIR